MKNKVSWVIIIRINLELYSGTFSSCSFNSSLKKHLKLHTLVTIISKKFTFFVRWISDVYCIHHLLNELKKNRVLLIIVTGGCTLYYRSIWQRNFPLLSTPGSYLICVIKIRQSFNVVVEAVHNPLILLGLGTGNV